MALAACASPSAADGPERADGTGSADRARPAAQSAALARQSDGADGADGALLHPLIPRAPRDFDPRVSAAAGGVHTVRIREERWSGGLRTQTMAAVLDWSGTGRAELQLTNTGGPMLDTADDDQPRDMRIRVLDQTVYGLVGGKPAEGAGGRHWVRLEGADAAGFSTVSATSMNPLKAARGLLTLPTTLPHGSGTLHGVRARHYRSTINEASLERISSGIFGAVAQQLRDALQSAGITSETIDLWVSEDRLPLEVAVQDDGPYGSSKEVTDYLDYGVAVDVQAPPAFDTVSSEELDAADG
jgi:hypothetical protein